MDIRFFSATILSLSLLTTLPAQAVEALDESDMGSVHITSGNVINIMGAPAAGGALPGDENEMAGPIEQTAGEVAAVTLAMSTLFSDTNRPEAQASRAGSSIIPLISRSLPNVTAPNERTIPSLDGSGATTISLIGKDVQSSAVPANPNRGAGLHIINSVRIGEIRRDNINFGNSNDSALGFSTIHNMEVFSETFIIGR